MFIYKYVTLIVAMYPFNHQTNLLINLQNYQQHVVETLIKPQPIIVNGDLTPEPRPNAIKVS